MKLEDQVCSLESAKRLKELGCKQESLWYWQHPWEDYCGNPPVDLGFQVDKFILVDYYHMSFRVEPFSAFTCAELGEMLPTQYYSTQMHKKSSWSCSPLFPDKGYVIEADTEAEARAKMLVYLRENQHETL